MCKKNKLKLAGGGSKCAKRINFIEGKPDYYQEGFEELADGSRKDSERT